MNNFRFDSPKQARIYDRLKHIGPGPARFYRDACILLKADNSLESKSHLVAHLFRDIESAICAVLEMPEDRDKRKKAKPEEGHRVKIQNILRILEISKDDKISTMWFKVIDSRLDSRAHRNALDRPRPINEEFQKIIDNMETIFDEILIRFECKYLEWFKVLDTLLLQKKPSETDLETLRNNVPNNPVSMGYFFEKLNHPGWLIPLHERGFFNNPPEPEINADNNGIHFPSWPQSNYLVKMAKENPEYVLKIIIEMPETTNVRIHDRLIDAFLAMPPEIAACGVLKVKTWLNSLHQQLFTNNYCKLILHLACGMQEEATLDLAKSLLEPKLEATTSTIIGHCDPWEYNDHLNEIIPYLMKISSTETLTLLCNILHESVQLSVDAQKTDHGFYPWRRTIELDEKCGPRDITEPLISKVRDVAMSQMESNGKLTLEIIGKYNYKIFKRIEMHLRRKYPNIDKGGTEKLIIDTNVFDDKDLQYEYYHLLKDQFGSFTPVTQTSYYKLIETGPSAEKQIETCEMSTSTELGKEEKEKILRYWQYTHLHPVSTYLDTKMTKIYSDLRGEFGELEHPDSDFSSGVQVGPTSPITSDEINSKPIVELIAFLKVWQPTKEFMSPSPEGLGRELQKIIILNPNNYAENAEKFIGLDPTYLRAIFGGFREVASQNNSLSWAPILNLCDWVMSQPREIPGRKRDLESFDSDWGWTRKAIAYMFIAGFQQGTSEIPFSLRKNVWDVLSQITNDPNPTLEDETSYEPSNFYPSELSINTTRGEAMHAVIQYARWTQDHTVGVVTDEAPKINGFDEMPEVRETLEYHLDIKNDPSLAIRSVYGRWFPYLFNIDSEWASRNVNTIFPIIDSLKTYFYAAWDAYVIFNIPYDGVFELLGKEYNYAIDLMASNPCDESRRLNPDKRLAEHMMIAYWQNKLNLTEQGGLMTKFYQKASRPLLAHAIEFVGFSLQKTETPIPPEIIDKLKTLWLHRLNIVKEQHPDDVTELIPFWRWFNSEKFDDEWAINQMIEVLRLRGRIEPEILITKRLAKLSSQMPSETITCLSFILGGEKEWWVIYSCKDDAHVILENGLHKGDEKTKEMARTIINKLAFNGYTDFRALLSS